MPRIKSDATFYYSSKSTDTSGDRYITFGSHANYLLNTGGISIWAKRGAWRTDGENVVELIQFGTSYVRVAFTGSVVTLTAYANAATIASSSYTLPASAVGTWHNIVVTWDSSSMIVYLDKTAVITVSGDKRLSFSANPSFYAGTGNAAGSGFMFDGYLTRAALYNAKLSTSDVEKIWNTQSPTSEQVAWDFTDGTGTVSVTRGTGNAGTLVQHTWDNDVPVKKRFLSRNIPYSLAHTGASYVSVGSVSDYSFIQNTGVFAIGGWLQWSNQTGLERGIMGNLTGIDKGFFFLKTAGEKLQVFLSNGSVTTLNKTSSSLDIKPYEKCFILLTSDGTNTYLYKGVGGLLQVEQIGSSYNGALSSGDSTRALGLAAITPTGIEAAVAKQTEMFVHNAYITAQQADAIFRNGWAGAGITPYSMWPHDEGSGTSLRDAGSAGKTGTITSPNWSTETPMKSRYKISTKTASLKLTAASLQKGTTAVGVNMSSATQLTVAGWFKINALTGTAQLLAGNTDATAGNNGWEIEYDNNAVLPRAFVFLISRGATLNYSRSSALKPGAWYRVVCVYDGSLAAANRAKIYINGYLDTTNSASGNTTGGFDSDIVTVGDRRTAGFYPNDQVGGLQIYPGVAATPAQVLQDFYNETPFGTPVANWQFNDGSGTTATDSSGNGYTLTFVNTPTWSSTDLPRKPRLQIPKQNLLIRSEEFDNASWTKNALTVSANAATAPDGTATADLCYPTSTGSARSAYQHVTKYKRGDYNTVSVYAKAAGLNYITFIDFFAGSFGTVWFNLSNGTIGTSAANYSGTILNVGNGWYRCTVKGFCTLTTVPYAQIIVCDADNSLTSTTSGTNGVYLWGAQWNTVSQATDYQATTSAAVNTGTPRTQIT